MSLRASSTGSAAWSNRSKISIGARADGGEHLQLLPQMRLGHERCQPEQQRTDDEQPERKTIEPGEPSGAHYDFRAGLDQFNAVNVRGPRQRDDGRAVLHRAGLAHHFATALFDFLAGAVGILDFERNMAKNQPEIVFFNAVIVGQLDDSLLGFRP